VLSALDGARLLGCRCLFGGGTAIALRYGEYRESVEVMLQGPPEQLADMCAWLRDGMPAALVQDLEVTPVRPPFTRFDDFERRPTL